MYAYNFATLYLGLRHTIAFSFMTSDPTAGGEGWPLIDKVDDSNICKNFPANETPHALHYCQRYAIGSSKHDEWYFIGKKRLPKSFVSCESPLLQVPPENLGSFEKYKEYKHPGANASGEYKWRQAKRESFMVCAMIRALNEAAKFYKDQHCHDGSGNYKHSLTFFWS